MVSGSAGFGVNSSGAIVGSYSDASGVVHAFLYSPESVAATPTFSPAAGTYTSAQSVSITDMTSGAEIYYTTNGSTPTASSTLYTGAISVPASETIEDIAVAAGHTDSMIATAAYTINLPQSFTLGASPSSLTVQSGSPGTVSLTITPQNGFHSAVSFACSGLPAGASCAFSPATVTPTGAPATTTLTIATTTLAGVSNGWKVIPVTALAFTICFFGSRRRRAWQVALVVAMAIAGLGAIVGCGNSSSSKNVTPVTTTITVTATSGVIQQTSNVSLTED